MNRVTGSTTPIFEPMVARRTHRGPPEPMPKRKRRLWQKNPFCAYCKRPLTYEESTLDHVKPRSKGGKSVMANLVLACMPCNSTKSSMDVREFREIVKRRVD